ncbi:MAG: transporter substrate-binding domain-containing protein [Candidatus Hadarchaeum sp.]|uniref:transporter substrate-binding domain-containing protein n=1 Tax=Candidatus Hadarchaeum sp. TaxID=2883567 RepID=UPI0031779526
MKIGRICIIVLSLMSLLGSCGLAQADRLAEILSRGVIKIGVMLICPPFGMYDENNQPVGFDVDLSRLIAEALGVRLEIVPVLAANRIPYLVTDQVDMVVGTFSRTAEREITVDYSVPYVRTGPALMVRSEETAINSIADCSGKKVAILKGTTGALWAKKLAPAGTTFVEYDYEPDQLLALMQRKVDALVQDETIISGWMDQYPGQFKIVGELFYDDYICIGLKQGIETYNLRNWLNWFLFELHRDGVIEQLWNKWFRIPMRPVPLNPFF